MFWTREGLVFYFFHIGRQRILNIMLLCHKVFYKAGLLTGTKSEYVV